MLVNLSAYVSQIVGRLRHHLETVLEHSSLRGRNIQIKMDHSFVLSRERKASSTLTSSVHQQLRSRSDAYKLAISLHSTSFEQSNEVILVVYNIQSSI